MFTTTASVLCCVADRRTAKPTRYADSDPEVQGFPEPKPDYSDDDFELPLKKASPKKKGDSFTLSVMMVWFAGIL